MVVEALSDLSLAPAFMAGGGREKDISSEEGLAFSFAMMSVEDTGVGRPGRGMARLLRRCCSVGQVISCSRNSDRGEDGRIKAGLKACQSDKNKQIEDGMGSTVKTMVRGDGDGD